MKKITIVFLLLFSLFSFAQSVTVTDLKVRNYDATTVNFGVNVSSVNVSLKVNIVSNYNTSKGTIIVRYKRNSKTATSPVTPTNGAYTDFYLTNGVSGSKTFTITLNRSEFDDTSGFVYVEYYPNPSAILAVKSSNINVTKLPDPIRNNTISGDQTIIEGNQANSINGSAPTGGNETFTYSWQQKIGNGSWVTIPGMLNRSYSPGNLVTTTSFRRIVVSSGVSNSTSNEVAITVLSAGPVIENNIITLNESTITGSLPSGGNGTYEYSWKYTSEEIGTFEFVGETGQNLILPSWIYNPNYPINVYQGVTVTRTVKSGNRILLSNVLTIQPFPETVNNTITLNGSTITGSLPSGGNGVYEYSWLYTSEEIGTFEFVGEVGQNLELPAWVFNPNYPINVYNGMTVTRVVKSRNRPLSSNTVKIMPYPETVNNTITLNGSTITGSLPSGGNGVYEYSWLYTSEEIGTFEFVGEVGQNLELPAWVYNSNYPINVYNGMTVTRVVKSRNRPSLSNVLGIPSAKSNRTASKGINEKSIFSDLTVYPNPTSESINFATNFSTDKNIEILLYSEKLGNEKSIYKGKTTPNQVINWSIPSNYQKGLYFYKILSDNNEVKSGKVIFN